MIPQELIRRKRDGGTLSGEEIAFLVEGIAGGGLSDGQVAALAMAIFFRDLAEDERVALTLAHARLRHRPASGTRARCSTSTRRAASATRCR